MVTTAPAKVSLAFVRRGVLLLLLILSLPWSTGNFLGTLVSVSWAAIAAYLLTAVVASRLILTAIIAAAFVLMYSQGLGDAIADGTTAAGFSVSEEDILSSVAGLVLFLAVLALTSVSTRNFCRRYIASRREGIIGQRDFEVALVVFLGLCFAAAVATETWSYWGDKEIRIEETGGVRLELFYPPALFVIWGFGALKWLDGTSRSPWSYSYSIVGVISVLLMFALQSRRLMLAVALLVALVMFYSTTHRALHSLALKVGTVVLILVLFTAGSSGWRDLDAYGEAATLSQRVEGAFKALVDPRSMEGIGSRLNYLSFDAMSHDLRQGYGVEADGVGLFLSELAIAIPRVIFSGKNEVESLSCETWMGPFVSKGQDLPCTPTGEGYLMAGFFGVLLAGIIWGMGLGIAEAAVERGPGNARIFGLFMLYPFFMIESGVFAIVQAIRLGVIGTVMVWLIATLVAFSRLANDKRGARHWPLT